MGTKQRREREKEALRQEILDAARELFVKEGYQSVSMRRIAEKIEYSPTTIYLYFKDKTELLFSLCEETFAILASHCETLLKDSSDPVSTLRSMCRGYVNFGLEHPNHYIITFVMPLQHMEGGENLQGRKNEKSQGTKAFGLLRASVEECVKQKKFREVDVDTASQVVWAAIHGVTSLLIGHPKFAWVDRPRLVNLMIDTTIEGLRA
ncbi:MAG TPA: TetR/AcrR family transcriptional regulator [Blastocatellia bacterium]|nr:TetR/AcrR family transcriptional regulator [Blastocatellia bacterium]